MTITASPTTTLLVAGDRGYDEHIATFNLATTHSPRYVVAARSTSDVAAAVRFAREHGLGVAVQATGHGAVAPVDGVLVSTREMQDVRIDPLARTATVSAGVRWRAVIDAAAPHGLAPLNGSSSDVGAVGYTVGGGLPVLGRTFGFSADHVRRLTAVTADGHVHEVTPSTSPDLFWGLLGGKGNLGIVTEMTVDLVPVPQIYGGGIFYPGAAAHDVLHAYREWSATLSEQTSTSIALLRLPPMPNVPEPLRGTLAVHLRVAHVGAGGADTVAPMRAMAPALLDNLGDLPYTAVDAIYQDPDHPLPVYERVALLPTLPAEAVDRCLALAGPQADTPVLLAELRQLGGALAREPETPNAANGRDAAFSFFALGVLAPGPETIAPRAVDTMVEAIRPFANGQTLVNMHGRPGDAADRARAWNPATYARLADLKAAYDPDEMFRFGHAIRLGQGMS